MRYEIDQHKDGRVSVYAYIGKQYQFVVSLHGTEVEEKDTQLFGHCIDVYNNKLYIGGFKHTNKKNIKYKQE